MRNKSISKTPKSTKNRVTPLGGAPTPRSEHFVQPEEENNMDLLSAFTLNLMIQCFDDVDEDEI